jgi:hypothetical protein
MFFIPQTSTQTSTLQRSCLQAPIHFADVGTHDIQSMQTDLLKPPRSVVPMFSITILYGRTPLTHENPDSVETIAVCYGLCVISGYIQHNSVV